MALPRTEIRARNLEAGDLFHEFGGDEWHEVDTIEHGDDVTIQTGDGGYMVIDGDSPVMVVRGREQTVLDALATYLGTSPEWNSDTWDLVNQLISSVRPDIGVENYGELGCTGRFREEMGRPAPAAFDATPELDDEFHTTSRDLHHLSTEEG